MLCWRFSWPALWTDLTVGVRQLWMEPANARQEPPLHCCGPGHRNSRLTPSQTGILTFGQSLHLSDSVSHLKVRQRSWETLKSSRERCSEVTPGDVLKQVEFIFGTYLHRCGSCISLFLSIPLFSKLSVRGGK